MAEVEEARKSYKGYQLLDMTPQNEDEVKFLHNLMITDDNLDFWEEPGAVGRNVRIMVSPAHFRRLTVTLRKQGIDYVRVHKDLNADIEPMWNALDKRRRSDGRLAFDINDFNTLDDINAWLTTTAANCPSTINCRVYSIGSSANGRPINVFQISKSGSGRKGYWIDATIHAREWIATATVLKTLDNFANLRDADAVRLTDLYDWYILPVMNPDGYDYTHTNDRLWRKNRRANAGSACYGTDLNRNFNFRWGTEGVSHSPCSETFCGPSGGSEPETQSVSAELNRLGSSLLATVTVHAYGQMWMFPWGNTVNHAGRVCERAADHDDLMKVADATANAIEATYTTRWSRGNSCEVIYETTGGTDDYAKGVSGVKYAFCPELRGNSFVINKDQIDPSFREFWNGIKAMCASISG
jgi:carboxypeptidase A2